jgi:integrase
MNPTKNTNRQRPRRANGRGSISERRDGILEVRISLPTGKRRKAIVRRLDGESKQDQRRRAEARLVQLHQECESGHQVPSGHLTVARYAASWVAREQEAAEAGLGRAPNTVEHYRQVFANYVNPYVGSRPLPELAVADVDRMLDALTKRGLSRRTIEAARNALGMLLKEARREGLVARLATQDARMPRRRGDDRKDPRRKALDPEQIRALFVAADGTRWSPILATLAYLGLRRGEALGLRWSDVNFEASTVTIGGALVRERTGSTSRLVLGATKTAGSERTLALPAGLAAVLRAWRVEQHRERLACGEGWGDGGWLGHDLLFTTPIGTPVDPDNLRHALARLGKAAGVGNVYPYRLRHSFASFAIEDGHTAPEVADLMGHGSPATTLAFYAHAFTASKAKAIESVAARYDHRVEA